MKTLTLCLFLFASPLSGLPWHAPSRSDPYRLIQYLTWVIESQTSWNVVGIDIGCDKKPQEKPYTRRWRRALGGR